MPFRVFSLANPALEENSNKPGALIDDEFIFRFLDGIDSGVSLFFWRLLQALSHCSLELLLIFQASKKPHFPSMDFRLADNNDCHSVLSRGWIF